MTPHDTPLSSPPSDPSASTLRPKTNGTPVDAPVLPQNGSSSATRPPSPGTMSAEPLENSRDKRILLMALATVMLLNALEATIVSTAMPTIVKDFGSVSSYSWAFSLYLIANTVSMPFYGRLADAWGRKPSMLLCVSLFMLGSLGAGYSQDMTSLLFFRVIQGLGAGGIFPVVFTVLGDMYTISQRARVQGVFTSIWGVAGLLGPSLGAIITEKAHWRWIFLLNVPFCFLSLSVLSLFVKGLPNRNALRGQALWNQMDLPGQLLLSLATLLTLFVALNSQKAFEYWGYSVGALLISTSCIWILLRRPGDLIPVDLFTHPIVGTCLWGNALFGALFMSISTYVPLYMQTTASASPTSAGAMLTPLIVCWAFSATFAAQIILKLGFRKTAVAGSSFILVGALGMVGATWQSFSAPVMVASLILIGLGNGPVVNTYLLAAQNVVPKERRGVTTSYLSFTRYLGASFGVAVLGSLLFWHLPHPGEPTASTSNSLPPDLQSGLRWVFLCIALISAIHWGWNFRRLKLGHLQKA